MWCVRMCEASKAAATAVSRCCCTLAPAPPTPSKMAAGPQVSITDKKTAGSSRVSLERDWGYKKRNKPAHSEVTYSKSFMNCNIILL